MAEINDAELAELRNAHNLLKGIYADDSVSLDFKKLVKRKFPAAVIPEVDMLKVADSATADLTKKVEEATGALSKKIDDFLTARAKEREDESVEAFTARVRKVVADRGYTKEGEEKLLGIMKERGIQSPEDAAILFESSQPKPTAKPREFSSRMTFVSPADKDDESFKQLMADPDQWMADELATIINNPEQE